MQVENQFDLLLWHNSAH